jgi:hypothetical protein
MLEVSDRGSSGNKVLSELWSEDQVVFFVPLFLCLACMLMRLSVHGRCFAIPLDCRRGSQKLIWCNVFIFMWAYAMGDQGSVWARG